MAKFCNEIMVIFKLRNNADKSVIKLYFDFPVQIYLFSVSVHKKSPMLNNRSCRLAVSFLRVEFYIILFVVFPKSETGLYDTLYVPYDPAL